jgi:competence protein ComEA
MFETRAAPLPGKLNPIFAGGKTMNKLIAVLAALLISATCWATGPVNINTASAEEIAESLKGIGPSKARLIVEYRDEHGAFTHVDELVNVKGIGLSTVDRNRAMILIGDAAPADEG